MPKPCPRLRADENRAFLHELARTGNARDAARAIGRAHSTMMTRRAADPNLAAGWDAAAAAAQARLHAQGGRRGPAAAPGAHRTGGGEPVVVRVRGGRIQLRAAHPGKLTVAAEQAFLRALSATANVRLSAAAAGASPRAFYARRRRCPAFAREWRMALELGWEQLQGALLADRDPASYAHDAWRRNEPPPVPPMTANQALQLLYLHQKEARLGGEPARVRRRRGEPDDVYWHRVNAMRQADLERERERFRVAEAERQASGRGSPYFTAEGLPDLAQVTGWSKAKPHAGSGAGRETAEARPKGSPQSSTLRGAPAGRNANPSDDAGFTPASGPVYHPQRALFGGWRLEDLDEREASAARKRRG